MTTGNRETVLLTGATGFIGSHIAGRLLSEGRYRIVAIVRKRDGSPVQTEMRRRGAILVEGFFLTAGFSIAFSGNTRSMP